MMWKRKEKKTFEDGIANNLSDFLSFIIPLIGSILVNNLRHFPIQMSESHTQKWIYIHNLLSFVPFQVHSLSLTSSLSLTCLPPDVFFCLRLIVLSLIFWFKLTSSPIIVTDSL